MVALPASDLRERKTCGSDIHRHPTIRDKKRDRANPFCHDDRLSISLVKSASASPNDNREQLDGTGKFPSIAAVLSKAKERDKRRVTAETDFYEHINAAGVTRRRSIMRTVDKDDFLVVRGANPRTGLITPEANSIAGSLDTERAKIRKRNGPSAQWKLEGDSWVSFVQDEERETPKVQSAPIESTSHAPRSNDNLLRVGEARHRKVSPLTEANLHSFEQIESIEELPTPSPDPAEPAVVQQPSNMSRIRRKPVGSPAQSNAYAKTLEEVRQPSDETVIRTPPIQGDSQKFSYFGPEDVSHATILPKQRLRRDLMHQDQPFLDMPVKARQQMAQRSRAFTGTRPSLDQLQQSLRTSSGPFPSHPSNPNRRIKGEQIDLNRGMHRTHHFPKLANKAQYPHLQPYLGPPVPRIRAMTAGRDIPMSKPGVRLERPQLSKPTPDPNIGFERQNSCPSLMSGGDTFHSTSQKSDATCFRVGNSPVTRRKQKEKIHIHESFQDREALKNDVQSIQPVNRRIEAEKIQVRSCADQQNSCKQDLKLDKSEQSRRPAIGIRSAETLNIPKVRANKTTTASVAQSNSTGIEQLATSAGAGDDIETVSNSLSERGTSDSDSPTLSAESKSLSSMTSWGEDNADLRDHSTCCPQCCVVSDCHEGCLGHPSPCASMADSETSSLRSMGVFDASFGTSVEAVNKALLEPDDKRNSKLAKLKNAIVQNFLQPPKMTGRPSDEHLKETLRVKNPTVYRSEISQITGPRTLKTKQARVAAAVAMGFDKNDLAGTGPRARKPKGARQRPATPAVSHRSGTKITSPNTDQGWDINNDASPVDEPANTQWQPRISPKPSAAPSQAGFSEVGSIVEKVTSLVRHNSLRLTNPNSSSKVVPYLLLAVIRIKDMLVVLLDTFTALSVILYEYKSTGKLVVPEGTKLGDIAGNCLRSLMYLMIAACVWALLARVSRVVLVVIRIVILPLKLVTWVIG